jgi:hypothetical protein
MKFFTGLAISATLVWAAGAAHAQMAGGRVSPASDIDGPYVGGPPAPVPAPEALPPPAPRYYDRGYYGPQQGYYGPQQGYYGEDYRDERDYRYRPAPRAYGPDYGYGYGYAPSLLSPHEIYAILRENGFSPLGAPRQRGYTYVIGALDRGGEDGRLIIDGRDGRIIRFVPASRWGQAYDRMSYQPAPPRDHGGPLPPPVVIKASPQVMRSVPPVANRAAAPAQAAAPTRPAPVATRSAYTLQKSAAVNEAHHPVRGAPQTAGTVGEAKPAAPQSPAASQIKPTEAMPQVQGLE